MYSLYSKRDRLDRYWKGKIRNGNKRWKVWRIQLWRNFLCERWNWCIYYIWCIANLCEVYASFNNFTWQSLEEFVINALAEATSSIHGSIFCGRALWCIFYIQNEIDVELSVERKKEKERKSPATKKGPYDFRLLLDVETWLHEMLHVGWIKMFSTWTFSPEVYSLTTLWYVKQSFEKLILFLFVCTIHCDN